MYVLIKPSASELLQTAKERKVVTLYNVERKCQPLNEDGVVTNTNVIDFRRMFPIPPLRNVSFFVLRHRLFGERDRRGAIPLNIKGFKAFV